MLDKLFFIIYNFYYSDGNYKKDQTPGLTVLIAFSMSFLFYMYIIYIIIEESIYGFGYNKISKRILIYSLGILSFIVIYFRFFFKKKSYRIYERYKNDEFLNSKKARIIGFSILIFGFVFMISYMFIAQAIRKGQI